MSQPATVPERTTDCPHCGGTGWRTLPPDADHKHSRVTRCGCQAGIRTERLWRAARVPEQLQRRTLENFITEFEGEYPPSLANAKLVAVRFVEEYPAEKSGLMFCGPSGVGKTHLAIGLIRELVFQKSIPCLFVDYSELLKQIQESYSPTVQTTELSLLRPLFEAEILVIDDLGATRPSEWVFDTVRLIINSRYNEGRTTIITTNYPDGPEIDANATYEQRQTKEVTLGDRIGNRMLSRLHEMCRFVEITGSDQRISKRRAGFRVRPDPWK